MQVFTDFVTYYNGHNKCVVVRYENPEADSVLNNVEYVRGEIAPTFVHDDKRFLRSIDGIIQEFDLQSEKFLAPTMMLNQGVNLDCFSQETADLIQGIGNRMLIMKDVREKDGMIYKDKIEKKDSTSYVWMIDIKDSDLIVSVCTKDNVLNVVWLLRNRKMHVLNRIPSIGMQTLPGNVFNILTDFQALRHGDTVVVTAAGDKHTSQWGLQKPAEESAFIAVMLYDIGKKEKPSLFAKIKCIPPPGKIGSPDVNPSFPVRFCSDGGKLKVRIYAKWSVKGIAGSQLVSWTIDVEKFTRDSLNEATIVGEDVNSNSSEGLCFDKTMSIKASSMDPYSSAGFVSAGGKKQVFTISENKIPSQVSNEIVKKYNPDFLTQEFDNICIEDTDKEEVSIIGIMYKTLFGNA